MYAKIINNHIEYAPRNKGTTSNYNKNVELMLADGYKPVADYTLAEDEYVKKWKDDGNIIAPVIEKIVQSEEELKAIRISELKIKLSETDYIACKIAEALDYSEQADLKEKYADVIAKRRQWRAELNDLLEEID